MFCVACCLFDIRAFIKYVEDVSFIINKRFQQWFDYYGIVKIFQRNVIYNPFSVYFTQTRRLLIHIH